LAGKADTTHNHDANYYTESEADTLLATKAATSHNHAASEITSGTLADGNVADNLTLVLEGATADDYETTLAVTDPTADQTITLPNASGTVVLDSTEADPKVGTLTASKWCAAKADGSAIDCTQNAPTVTESDPQVGTLIGSNWCVAKADGSAIDCNQTAGSFTTLTASGNVTLGDAATDTVTVTGSLLLEGATADDHETTLAVTDPTADQTITLPNASGTVVLESTTACTDNKILKKSGGVWVCDNDTSVTFAGSGSATTAAHSDHDHSGVYADAAATTTALAGKADAAATTTALAGVLEGATADDYETTLAVTDPTADQTITLPNASGTVVLDSTEADPKVGTLTASKWCAAKADGSAIDCTQNAPLTTESDPKVGSLTSGKWCSSDGSKVNCTENAPSGTGDITSVVAGDGLITGGTTGDVTLDVKVDGSTLEISTDTLQIKDGGVTENKLAASLTFDDGDLVDLSPTYTTSAGTTKGLILPKANDVSTATAIGQISWDIDDKTLYVGDGTTAISIGATTDADGNLVFKDSNGNQVLKIIPGDGTDGPNIIGGDAANGVTTGVKGATIAGGGSTGNRNFVTDNYGTVGGGQKNQAGTDDGTLTNQSHATVAGGQNNTASGKYSSIGGGQSNTASGQYSTVGGGKSNTAGYLATVVGGLSNTASGSYSTVVGGSNNEAKTTRSLAGGNRARVMSGHQGTFLWADSNDVEFRSIIKNEFAVRATEGVRFVTAVSPTAGGAGVVGAPTAGATLVAGSSTWSTLSDRNAKENFSPVDTRQVLEKVVALPLETWNYKTQEDSIRHIGPMAQDFHAAFGTGQNNKTITTVDADGVALAAIQGLYQLVQDQRALLQKQQAELQKQQAELQKQQTEITTLKAENHEMHTGLQAVKAHLERLEKSLQLRVAGGK